MVCLGDQLVCKTVVYVSRVYKQSGRQARRENCVECVHKVDGQWNDGLSSRRAVVRIETSIK